MLDGASILVVDDTDHIRETLDLLLTREGCHVRLASTGESGLEHAKAESFDAILLDVKMPGMGGLEALEEFKKSDDGLPVIMITAAGTVRNTREAFKRGAFDFIEKPFNHDELLVAVRNAVERRRLLTENRALRQNLLAQSNRFSNIIGRSPRIRHVFELISRAAPSRTTPAESATHERMSPSLSTMRSAFADPLPSSGRRQTSASKRAWLR